MHGGASVATQQSTAHIVGPLAMSTKEREMLNEMMGIDK